VDSEYQHDVIGGTQRRKRRPSWVKAVLALVVTQSFMTQPEPSEITRILDEWNEGDLLGGERMLPFVYHELKRSARFLMSRAARADFVRNLG